VVCCSMMGIKTRQTDDETSKDRVTEANNVVVLMSVYDNLVT